MEIERGFYYHNRHDPNGPIENCAYEVMGTAFSTESPAPKHSENPEDFLADEVVIYRPLYDNSIVYKNGKRFWYRPIKMFLESVKNKEGNEVSRFQKITDPKIIHELEKIRNTLYF